MAKKISELIELAVENVLDSDFFAIVNNAQTKKVTKASFVASVIQGIKDFYTYDYEYVEGVTITSPTYAQVARLITEERDAGTYTITNSMLYSYDNINRSAYFRFSLDAGINWVEIRKEPKDNTDKLPESYTTTLVHTGGAVDVRIEARTDDAADTLTLYKLDIMLERKK